MLRLPELNFYKYTTPAPDAQALFQKKHNTRARIYTGAGGQDQPVVINAKRSTNSRHSTTVNGLISRALPESSLIST